MVLPVLALVSLNGTFERKYISVPYFPVMLRIGRQTNHNNRPTPTNGFFDSKVMSRQHAEIWADESGKIWIRDSKSFNGTVLNGTRLSQETQESEPHPLETHDHLEFGIDIIHEDQKTIVHHKVAARVETAGYDHAAGVMDETRHQDLLVHDEQRMHSNAPEDRKDRPDREPMTTNHMDAILPEDALQISLSMLAPLPSLEEPRRGY